MRKIICIEEHANDPGIAMAAVFAMMEEAPYMALCQSERVAAVPPEPAGSVGDDAGRSARQ